MYVTSGHVEQNKNKKRKKTALGIAAAVGRRGGGCGVWESDPRAPVGDRPFGRMKASAGLPILL